MPPKYHIHAEPAPPRFRPDGKLGIVEWREDCANCRNCVKDGCVYDFYRSETDILREEVGYLDYVYQCKGCLNCVQDCTKGILTRVTNPEYERLGDEYYSPDILLATWYQAETGSIPVSGSGYGGKFSGPGFDSMWTDMSEIVRPTRDGIHGREYINTSVDIGRKLMAVSFEDGKLVSEAPPLIETPMPLIFNVIPEHWRRGPVQEAIVKAAATIGSMALVDAGALTDAMADSPDNVIPVTSDGATSDAFSNTPMTVVEDCENIATIRATLKEKNSSQIVAVRVTASPEAAGRVLELARDGVEVVVVAFDLHGREQAPSDPRHMRDVLREVHGALTKEGIRDEITLIASGGIALAEHMAKAIICGADLIAVDAPLVIALECRMCGACQSDGLCPIDLDEIDLDFAARRIINLICAWRNQFIELLGAMGIREARRLRGETGRCMFFEDLEANTFGRLFGKRIGANGGQGQ